MIEVQKIAKLFFFLFSLFPGPSKTLAFASPAKALPEKPVRVRMDREKLHPRTLLAISNRHQKGGVAAVAGGSLRPGRAIILHRGGLEDKSKDLASSARRMRVAFASSLHTQNAHTHTQHAHTHMQARGRSSPRAHAMIQPHAPTHHATPLTHPHACHTTQTRQHIT